MSAEEEGRCPKCGSEHVSWEPAAPGQPGFWWCEDCGWMVYPEDVKRDNTVE